MAASTDQPAQQSKIVCQICKKSFKRGELIPADAVSATIANLIAADHPDWSPSSFICKADLDKYRALYVGRALEEEKGELTKLEAAVVQSLAENEIIARNINNEFDSKKTFGERAADKVAEFGGSWRFIGIFAAVLFGWILLNALLLANKGFDPYPFILLNLVLSCLASIQAPIIMMSQNRQSAKDRLQAEHDYQVNLKAEVEIRNLHEKMDHLLNEQWQRLLEIQQIQTDLVEEIIHRSDHKGSSQ